MTTAFARGTDVVCYDEELQAVGGLHVLTTFFSAEISRSRTARQGRKGFFSMVFLARELESEFAVSKEDRRYSKWWLWIAAGPHSTTAS